MNGETGKHRGENCDLFSACSRQHTNAVSSEAYCRDARRCDHAPPQCYPTHSPADNNGLAVWVGGVAASRAQSRLGTLGTSVGTDEGGSKYL
jgi:hypothetical protein